MEIKLSYSSSRETFAEGVACYGFKIFDRSLSYKSIANADVYVINPDKVDYDEMTAFLMMDGMDEILGNFATIMRTILIKKEISRIFKDGICFIDDFNVKEPYQNKGIGTYFFENLPKAILSNTPVYPISYALKAQSPNTGDQFRLNDFFKKLGYNEFFTVKNGTYFLKTPFPYKRKATIGEEYLYPPKEWYDQMKELAREARKKQKE